MAIKNVRYNNHKPFSDQRLIIESQFKELKMQKFPSLRPYFGLSLPIAISLLNTNSVAFAQAIQNDNTLSGNGFTDSIVNQMGDTYTITGGTELGPNLFHSFLEFSVPNFGRAIFNNNLTVENIISRVTGANISNIQGLIQANGTANLFLINPNGITIGPNAGLDIGGSFVATTADSIEFLGGGRYSAKNPNSGGTLLTMTAPLGLQMGTNPGQIVVEGFGNNLVTDPNTFEIIDLPPPPNLPPQIPPDVFVLRPFAVRTGETLALVGGDIIFNGGNIEAAQGRIELAAFSNGLVNFTTTNGQLQISPPTGTITYGDISLSGASSVDVSGNNGGSVQVQGKNFILSGGSVILANTTGNGSGGEITVQTTESIEATGIGVMSPMFTPSGVFAHQIFSGIFAEATSQSTENAQGGNIRLNTQQLIVRDGAQIGANTFGAGKGGQLTVDANNVNLSGESVLGPSGLFTVVAPNASGVGGRLSLNTQTLNLADGARINFSTFGTGNGGTGTINATEINMSGTSAFSGEATGVFSNVEDKATGQGGRVNINAANLQLRDGAQISALTFSSGNAGTLNIQANNIDVQGTSELRPSAIGSEVGRLNLPEDTARGNGGNIIIDANRISLRDGGIISTNTAGLGQGGNIQVNAEIIEVLGGAPQTASGLFSAVSGRGRGNGGQINVNTDRLLVKNGGQIVVSTEGFGNGGNLQITANSVELLGSSPLGASGFFANAIVGSGNGGNINLSTQNLTIAEGATINVGNFPSATTSRPPGTGSPGNITIEAQSVVLNNQGSIQSDTVAGSQGNINLTSNSINLGDNSRISTNAQGDGSGGTINLTTNNLTLNTSDITANATGTGSAGNVNINSAEERPNISLNNSQITATGNQGNVNLTAENLNLNNNSEIATEGNQGNITANSNSINLGNNSRISTNAQGDGSGGTINLTTNNLTLNTSDITANAIGTGSAGNVNINPAEGRPNISLNNAQITATGNQGNVNLTADNLNLNNNSEISTEGNQGNITANSNSINLGNNSRINTNAQGDGSGGTINLTTNNLTLNNSDITTNATGTGSAGNVNINPLSQSPQIRLEESQITATGNQGNIRMISENTELHRNSRISANAEGDGNGGNINIINNNDLILQEGSEISTNAQGTGQGGNMDIVTGSLTIESNSQITSNASAASGGNVNVRATSPRSVTLDNGTISSTGGQGNITVISPITFLRNGSLISTNGTGTEPGGNIIINTDFVLSFVTDNNDITANAQQSLGGRVLINALGVFGIEFREFLTPLSDITVTSELGPAFSGQVFIRVPEGDPTSGFTKLPENTTDPSDLIVVACSADEGNIFIRTGRGGIPDNPEQPLGQPIIWEDLRDFIELEDPEMDFSPQSNTEENSSIHCSF